MRHSQRFFYNDNGTIQERTIELNNFRGDTFAMSHVSAEDYLYVATEFPMNSLYFDVTVANGSAASPEIDLWTGDEWQPVVAILDYTATSNDSLANSGFITWNRDIDETAWKLVSDTRDEQNTPGFQTLTIFNRYWTRIKWSADITATINYIGPRFSEDTELYSLYPDFNNQRLRDRWAQGSTPGTKTDWKEQSIMASNALIDDLKERGIILSDKQILDFEAFEIASIHKTAVVIYGGMGSSHRDDMERARVRYEKALDMKKFGVDKDRDGNLSLAEKASNITFMSR